MKDAKPPVDWRCHGCGKLLAKRQADQLHVNIGQKFRYVIDGKVTCVCPRCEALNSTQSAEEVSPKQ